MECFKQDKGRKVKKNNNKCLTIATSFRSMVRNNKRKTSVPNGIDVFSSAENGTYIFKIKWLNLRSLSAFLGTDALTKGQRRDKLHQFHFSDS